MALFFDLSSWRLAVVQLGVLNTQLECTQNLLEMWSHKNEECPYWDFSANASWRSSRLTPEAFLKNLQNTGAKVSPLLSAPAFSVADVAIDILHTCDLGVCQDLLGSIFRRLWRSGVALSRRSLPN